MLQPFCIPERGRVAALDTYLTECLVSVMLKTQLVLPIRASPSPRSAIRESWSRTMWRKAGSIVATFCRVKGALICERIRVWSGGSVCIRLGLTRNYRVSRCPVEAPAAATEYDFVSSEALHTSSKRENAQASYSSM